MATKSGRIASVRLGTVKIAGQGTWTLSGFSREVIEEDSWDLDVKNKHFGIGDAGEVSFSGLYDALDATGQDSLNSACMNSSLLTGFALRFYVDSTSFWTATTGGSILITKVMSITMEKSGMGTCDFTGVINGGGMVFN
jgi:hypothetical protein